METPILDRPIPESSAPWPLSAPESYVLLHGPRAKSVEAFKRGLLELVARDVLTVETRERPRCFHLFTEQASFLHTGPNMSRGELAAQPLQAIWDIYRRTSLCTSWGDPPGVLVSAISRDPRGRSAHLSETLRTGPSCPLWWSVGSMNATTMRHRDHLEARDTRRPQPAEPRGPSSSR